MLRFSLRLEFDPCVSNEATQTFRSLVGPVRAEPGCSSTRLLTDMDGSGVMTWTEEWRDWESFERHIEAKTFRRLVAAMELAVRAPTVEIDEVSERHGFEIVEKLFSERFTGSGELLKTRAAVTGPSGD